MGILAQALRTNKGSSARESRPKGDQLQKAKLVPQWQPLQP
jgi:hypothetical protein